MDKFKKVANVEGQVYFPNEDDWKENFWKRNYLIHVTAQGFPFAVNADCEQDALDYIIDYCEEHLTGLIMDTDRENELINDRKNDLKERLTVNDYKQALENDEQYVYLDEYISGGNHGKHLNTHNVRIEELNS